MRSHPSVDDGERSIFVFSYAVSYAFVGASMHSLRSECGVADGGITNYVFAVSNEFAWSIKDAYGRAARNILT